MSRAFALFLLLFAAAPAAGAPRPIDPADLADAVRRACLAQGCPPEVLWAVALARTGLRDDTLPGSGRVGPFGLVPGGIPSLERAAALAGEDPARLAGDLDAQARSAAAMLTSMAFAQPPARDPAVAWVRASAGFAGSDDPAAVAAFLDDVRSALARGGARPGAVPAPFAPVIVVPEDVLPPFVERAASPDYPAAAYAPACYVSGASGEHNYTLADRPDDGNTIDYIIVHVMQGSYSSAVYWFQDCDAGSSAHYNVSDTGAITQSVLERHIAWHAGNWYVNVHSIGIEHAGFIDDPSFPDAMYAASAKLVSHLCQKYGIPCDRDHVFGHDEVPGCPYGDGGGGAHCHTDPGPNWDWDRFMALVDGGPLPPPTGRLLGVIRENDIYSGANIPDATVTLSNGWSTTTGSNGVYQFASVPEGTYTVTADAPGYAVQTATKEVIGGTDNWKSMALVPCSATCLPGTCGGDGCGRTCACDPGEVCDDGQCVVPPPEPEPIPDVPEPAADLPDVPVVGDEAGETGRPDVPLPDPGAPADAGTTDEGRTDLGTADVARTDHPPTADAPSDTAGPDAIIALDSTPVEHAGGGGCQGGTVPVPGLLLPLLVLGWAWITARRGS